MLAKELETRIKNKIVNTTDNGCNFVKAFNVHGETAETVEEESYDEERSSCSSGNVGEDTIQPVLLLLILEGDNDEEGVGVFFPKHMRCISHTLNLVATTDAGEIRNKQSRSSKALDVIKHNISFLLQVPTATQWNFAYNAIGRLIAIFDNQNI